MYAGLSCRSVLEEDGVLTLSNLPLCAGEAVEVIILVQPHDLVRHQHYPLRGTSAHYSEPTKVVVGGVREHGVRLARRIQFG
jgi:hypothetical protein